MSEFTLRSHETADYKRCKKKWYWKWRRGLVLKARKFGALDLGTWMHAALAAWYEPGLRRKGHLASLFADVAYQAARKAARDGAPEYELERAEELSALGEEVCNAYEKHYDGDPDVHVLDAEIPLEFEITTTSGELITIHKLKPDLVYRDRKTGDVWVMEHKTASQIQTSHLVIDGQARPYGVMVERALHNLGILTTRDRFCGIMYNFLRKALPDERPTNEKGQYLNKNGSVSARQPGRQFLRHPVTLTRAAKVRTFQMLAMDAAEISFMTAQLRQGYSPSRLPITPDKSCPRFCEYFDLCVATEQGSDTRNMEETLFLVRDPYLYDEETTEDKSEW